MHTGAQRAKFSEKVHKPQRISYGRIGATIQIFYTYLIILNTSIRALRLILGSEGRQGADMDALNPFSSKLMTLTPRGGL